MPSSENQLQRLKDGFSLVLSGGGALGYAHIGVMRFLAENGLQPKEIIGTSMGAIVGAASAIGLDEQQIMEQIERFSSVTNWARPSFSDPALLNTSKLDAIFTSLFGELRMSNLQFPLRIVATDFNDGSIRVFDNRDDLPLRDAVRCSMSIPVLFPPVALDGSHYVDGFLCANLPVEEVSDPSLPIVAVDVMSERTLDTYQPGETSFLERTKAIIDSYERALYLLIRNQTRDAMETTPDTIRITPHLAGYKIYHFHKHQPIVEAGYEAAQAAFTSGN
jgi:NTE family protein